MSQPKPIVYVDLDGTLTPSDLLLETALRLVRSNFLYVWLMIGWAMRGAWFFKQQVFARMELDFAQLPIRDSVVARLREYKESGHSLVLASASPLRDVSKIADRLKLFDRVIASEQSNLKGEKKLQAILSDCHGKPFIYLGDAAVDIPIWRQAQVAIAVNPGRVLAAKARLHGVQLQAIRTQVDVPNAALKAMRPQQWAKNALLFLPLMVAHESDLMLWVKVFSVFWAFSLVASSTYIWNDLMDLPSDRVHPRKKNRPMASGALSIAQALVLMKLVGVAGFVLAWLAGGLPVLLVVTLYTLATLLYTFVLKRIAFIDVLTLGLLYTLRVIAGGVAAGLVVSNWLLATSLFVFLSLALVKRCAELEFLQLEGGQDPQGRGYRMSDLGYLVSMGVSSGFMAVTVIALYVDSQAGSMLYSQPLFLWGICPVFLYWIMRIWILTSRKEMMDDPVHFAIHDRVSWCVLAVIALLVWFAS
ncbi:MAG: UbiA family prenyltransferase [Limnobacter sp.]|nr:UbiA family prenyltransferase [Limnobacter sp.]